MYTRRSVGLDGYDDSLEDINYFVLGRYLCENVNKMSFLL